MIISVIQGLIIIQNNGNNYAFIEVHNRWNLIVESQEAGL